MKNKELESLLERLGQRSVQLENRLCKTDEIYNINDTILN